MPLLNRIIEHVTLFLPLLLTAFGVGVVLCGAHKILIGRHPELGSERMFPRQLAMMGLTLSGIVGLVLALPVSESSRNQIIGLIGLVISAIFAFSSGNIFANLAAGILLRFTKPFRIGDFIHVRDYFGRVAERGLFDTEIQSETRELIAIPNTYLISNPVSAVRSTRKLFDYLPCLRSSHRGERAYYSPFKSTSRCTGHIAWSGHRNHVTVLYESTSVA